MKVEDLAVAAENAAKKESELKEITNKFITYSEAFMRSAEYSETLAILTLVLKPGSRPVLQENKRTGAKLIFNSESEGMETPFSTFKTLSWIEVVRDWAPQLTDKAIDDESLAQSFWEEFVENVNGRAYWYRREHEPEFHQSEIARENEEYAAKKKAEARKSWRSFFVWTAVLIFFTTLGIMLFG
jgi:hypothetical protein